MACYGIVLVLLWRCEGVNSIQLLRLQWETSFKDGDEPSDFPKYEYLYEVNNYEEVSLSLS
jgi:hypothetical protein